MAKRKTTVTPANASAAQATSESIPFWGDASNPAIWEDRSYNNPYDKVYLNGLEVPGICEVSGGLQNAIDVQKRKGESGSNIKYNGTELVKLDVAVTMWTPRHKDLYVNLLKLIQPGAAKKGLEPTIVALQYPPANAVGVLKVLVDEISLFKVDDKGVATFQIKLQQYEAPKPTKPAVAQKNTFQGTDLSRTGGDSDRQLSVSEAENDAKYPPTKKSWAEVARG